MIVAHIMGIPVEESVLQLVPAGAAIVSVVVIAARATLDRFRMRLHRRPHSPRDAVTGLGRVPAAEANDFQPKAELRR